MENLIKDSYVFECHALSGHQTSSVKVTGIIM